jgi:hypothetical protein
MEFCQLRVDDGGIGGGGQREEKRDWKWVVAPNWDKSAHRKGENSLEKCLWGGGGAKREEQTVLSHALFLREEWKVTWCVQTGSGAHPASYSLGTGGSSLELKRPRREAGHSPPSNAEIKNAWSYNTTPQYAFMAWCLVNKKHRDEFTLPLLW